MIRVSEKQFQRIIDPLRVEEASYSNIENTSEKLVTIVYISGHVASFRMAEGLASQLLHDIEDAKEGGE